MTQSVVVCTDAQDSTQAGRSLGDQIRTTFQGNSPDAVILFVSPRFDAAPLLRELQSTCSPAVMVGCSSAGEFTSHSRGEGLACAVALRSTEMQFAASMGRGLSEDRGAAARQIVSAFKGIDQHARAYHSALLLTDALAGHADEFIEQLVLLTGAEYQFVGGGAGDDANFRRTQVFCGTEVASDAAVGLEILSDKPLGVGVRHGWKPAGAALRVTQAEGARVISLNAIPAVEVFEEHAAATGQHFNRASPLPFFLHNILGIDTGQGFKLRVPLGINPDGSISCAAEIPLGSAVRIMSTSAESAAEAATQATRTAMEKLNGNKPNVALFFDCVATRLRMGKEFGFELQKLQDALGTAEFAGCNTYGQVARAEGQFSGFHNCTAVVCVIPG
ncbi:MAG: hypothetical protein JWN40_1745 [Phycisphaerales bacterium]|nr:hypothetical protein [Phycisphaerales bacterium]